MQIWTQTDESYGAKVAGLFGEMRVATSHGWRRADDVVVGDRVLTRDAGPQEVIAVGRSEIGQRDMGLDPSDWPLFVPVGVLGNQSDMIVMPEQLVLIESELAARLLGQRAVLIRAADLDSVAGVCRVTPAEPEGIVHLAFAKRQLIYGAGGAVLMCPLRQEADAKGRVMGYRVLSPGEADMVLSQEMMPGGMVQGQPVARCFA